MTYNPREERPVDEPTPMGYGITFLLSFVFAVITAYALFTVFWYDSLYQKAIADFEEKYSWEIAAGKRLDLPPPTVQERWCEAQGHCGPARVGLMDSLIECQEELKVKFPDLVKVGKKIGCGEFNEAMVRDYWLINADIEEYYDDVEIYSKHARALCSEELFELEQEHLSCEFAFNRVVDLYQRSDMTLDYYRAHCPKAAAKSFIEIEWWWEKDRYSDE
jgi:hypothetical protein